MIANDDKAVHISHDTLRLGIGWLGVSLPFLLVAGAQVFQTSISDYYYTNMRDYFEGVLFFLSFFLFAYRPYGQDGWHDNWITSLSAVGALLLALFPTNNESLGHLARPLILNFVSPEWSGNLHNLGSGLLFVCFAILSLFFFTRGKKGAAKTGRKVARNVLYVLLGLGIAGCIGFIGWGAFTAPDQAHKDLLNILVPEATALVLFGLSWLIKGGQFPFLNDRRTGSPR